MENNRYLSPAITIGQDVFTSFYAQRVNVGEDLDVSAVSQRGLLLSIENNAPFKSKNGIVGLKQVQIIKDYFSLEMHIQSNYVTEYIGSIIHALGYSVPHLLDRKSVV